MYQDYEQLHTNKVEIWMSCIKKLCKLYKEKNRIE